MTEGSPMMYHSGGGFGNGTPVYMMAGAPAEHPGPRQYPLEMLQYMGGLVERGAPPPPRLPDAPRRDPQAGPKGDNTAFGYESDDSSLSSNASGSNKSSDKGDSNSHTSEASNCSSNAVTYNNNNYNNHNSNNNGYNNGYTYHNGSREWRGRNRREQNRPRRIAPDRYLNSNYPFQVKYTPDDLLNGSKWDTLSQEIWDKFVKAQQTEETFRKKMNLWRYLYVTIRSIFPRYGLYVVGSTMSGFALERSDMDLCLHVRGEGGGAGGAPPGLPAHPRAAALLHLGLLLQLVRNIDSSAELIQAKVPILKFGDARLGLTVDLNCNNVVGIKNTNLLYCYSRMDWRVRPLVVACKLWAAAHDINDARRRTLASYPLTLMVIHFLQCGVSPPVLGALGGPGGPGALGGRRPPNKMPLGELFVRLLHYYAHFPFARLAVSVRLGRALPVAECRAARACKNDPGQWKLLCVEEPFDLTNTARSVYDPETFERIVDAFRSSAMRLAQGLRLEDAWPSEPR